MLESELSRPSVLLVDDDEALLCFADFALAQDGFETVPVRSAEDALGQIERRSFDLVVTDLRMPGMSGLELLAELRRSHPGIAVIIATAFGSIDSAVEAMRSGASDYVTKPLAAEELKVKARRALKLQRIEAENRWLHEELAAVYRPGRIVAVSHKMRDVVAMVDKLARSDATVLVTGESGTGKELLAQALHYGGPRANGPFVAVNCAAIPAGLIESELFGHLKGSFTSAVRDQIGKMEMANKGTLFLDEVGEMPLEMQPKLLRSLQERTFERVGEHKPRKVDVRFVAATNRDLDKLVKEGKFREDLYYRLAVVPVYAPALRERAEDIAPLTRFLLAKLAGVEAPELTDEALALLTRRSWPGNVRELANLIERVLALHGDGPITAAEIPSEGTSAMLPQAASGPSSGFLVSLPNEGASLDAMVRDLIVQALDRKGWNQSAAARFLHIPRHILQDRMMKFGIAPPSREGN